MLQRKLAWAGSKPSSCLGTQGPDIPPEILRVLQKLVDQSFCFPGIVSSQTSDGVEESVAAHTAAKACGAREQGTTLLHSQHIRPGTATGWILSTPGTIEGTAA